MFIFTCTKIKYGKRVKCKCTFVCHYCANVWAQLLCTVNYFFFSFSLTLLSKLYLKEVGLGLSRLI